MHSILDACMATEQGQVNSCASTDYSCLCTQYGNLLTCYNNCPNDPGVTTVQQQREQYCNAASIYDTTTTMSTTSATSVSLTASATTSPTSASAAQSGFATASNTGTSSSASASSSSSQHNGVARSEMAGSLIALVLAGLGLVL
jgi:hypothetical protein